MIIRKLTKNELETWGMFSAWKRINDNLTHEIWLRMNPDNYACYLNLFDHYLNEKWEEYAKLN